MKKKEAIPVRDIFGGAHENEAFLTEQIITYIGNKRSLLDFIGKATEIVKTELRKEKLDIVDVFSGSGVVSRYFKQFSDNLYINDLEDYCYTINNCYLANRSQVDMTELIHYFNQLKNDIKKHWVNDGFIYQLYAPKNDQDIQMGERVFYTTRNAQYIDSARQALEKVPEPYKTYLLAPLLYGASVHNNTSGVFKGFYKNSQTGIGQYGGDGRNALKRILSDIEVQLPIFSEFECNVHVLQRDANLLPLELPEVDLAYMDPPYNQHPYGSNYFMLNLINSYKAPTEVSGVSGIPKAWNKSQFNKRQSSKESMRKLCEGINAKYLLISFNSEGFISLDEMVEMLSEIGEVRVMETQYNTFRGSRNLDNRDIHVKEFLYLVKKRG
jgi:adenine-specific DNA-methyltransferase